MDRSGSKSRAPANSLYFIAVIPDPFFQNEVKKIKTYIFENYGSAHALRSPAHITLHMPFKWRDDRAERLTKVLKDFSSGRSRFFIDLKNYNAFIPRTIYIHMNDNEDLNLLESDLKKVAQERMKLDNARYKNKGFTPHMTVAFRDLKRSQFVKAWEEFKDKQLNHRFEVRSIFLLKHNGKSWDIFQEFMF